MLKRSTIIHVILLATCFAVASAYAGLPLSWHALTSGGSLPAGVTVQALDGESCGSNTDPTSCTHNYFSRSGYTAAGAAYTGTSWDDPSFLMNMVDYGLYSGELANFQSTGMNITDLVTSDTPASTLTSNNIWALLTVGGGYADENTVSATGTTLTMAAGSGLPVSPTAFYYASDGTVTIPNGTYLTSGPTSAGANETYQMSNAVTPGGTMGVTPLYGSRSWDPNIGTPPFGSEVAGVHNDETFGVANLAAIPDADLQGRGAFLNWVSGRGVLSGYLPTGAPSGSSLLMSTWLGACPVNVVSYGCRAIGLYGVDFYPMAGQGQTGFSGADISYALGLTSGVSSDLILRAQAALASNYGNIIDEERSWGNGVNAGSGWASVVGTSGAVSRLPFCVYVENWYGNLEYATANTNDVTLAADNVLHFASVPSQAATNTLMYDDSGTLQISSSNYIVSTTSTTVTLPSAVGGSGIPNGDRIHFLGQGITPEEMQWVVWSSTIHGARCINYFTDMSQFVRGGTLTQATTTTTLMNSLSHQLNSPFALGYVTSATDSAYSSGSGYKFPTPTTDWFNGGIEVAVHYCPVSGGPVTCPSAPGFYIFADTRDPEGTTSIATTFTINDSGKTSCPKLSGVNSPSAISGSAGAETFTYTFATEHDVFICGPVQ